MCTKSFSQPLPNASVGSYNNVIKMLNHEKRFLAGRRWYHALAVSHLTSTIILCILKA